MKLTAFGFVRITSGRDTKAYYHELFVRGQKELLLFLRRVKIDAIIKDTAPNFYTSSRPHIIPQDADEKHTSVGIKGKFRRNPVTLLDAVKRDQNVDPGQFATNSLVGALSVHRTFRPKIQALASAPKARPLARPIPLVNWAKLKQAKSSQIHPVSTLLEGNNWNNKDRQTPKNTPAQVHPSSGLLQQIFNQRQTEGL